MLDASHTLRNISRSTSICFSEPVNSTLALIASRSFASRSARAYSFVSPPLMPPLPSLSFESILEHDDDDNDDADAEGDNEVANLDAIDASTDISRSLLTTFVMTSSGEVRGAEIAF